MDNTVNLFISGIVIVVAILIFLAVRAVMLWYWKIDEIVDNQKNQIELLKEILHEAKKPILPKSEIEVNP